MNENEKEKEKDRFDSLIEFVEHCKVRLGFWIFNKLS
jgi:hypothetical protein